MAREEGAVKQSEWAAPEIWCDNKPDLSIKRRPTSSFFLTGCYALLTAMRYGRSVTGAGSKNRRARLTARILIDFCTKRIEPIASDTL